MNRIHQRRIVFLLIFLGGLSLACFLVVRALDQNINLFYTPTQVKAQVKVNEVKKMFHLRVGGVVQKGSVIRGPGVEVRFIITDFTNHITVHFSGILPDLFKEGQGVIAGGHLQKETEHSNFILMADEVLAKHDENYQPPRISYAP